MVLTVLTMGGFMAWLGTNAKPGTVAVVEDTEAPVDFGAAEMVTLDELAANASGYVGRAIRLDRVPVSSRLGGYAFWAVTSNGMPFLVKLDQALVEGGFTVQDGQALNVVGQVREMSAAVLDGWEASGVLTSSDDRMVAEFATEYLDVVQAAHAGESSEE
jgi:hypothetical protein